MLPGLPSEVPNSYGYDINNVGHLTGKSMLKWGPPVSEYTAFLWREELGTVSLGDLPGGKVLRSGFAIDDLDIVVGLGTPSSGGAGFFWNPFTDEMISLGTGANPTDINNALQLCGTYIPGQYTEAFLWTPAGGMQFLGVGEVGQHMDYGEAINEKGRIVGSNTDRAAGFWDPAEGLVSLPMVDGANYITWMTAFDVNDLEQIVGYAGGVLGAEEGEVAFIWDALNGTRRVHWLLDASSKKRISSFSQTLCINNQRQILVRSRTEPDAYLLVPVVLRDMNCDGAVASADVPIFLSALAKAGKSVAGPDEPATEPLCDWWAGDINQDGKLDADDLPLFLELLTTKKIAD